MARAKATRNIIESVVLGVVLTALSYLVGIEFNWVDKLNWLEVFAVFTSYSCTYLCVRERRINYPIGAVSTAAYTVLFFQQHLVASAILNAYLTPVLVYGWIRWRTDANTRPVTLVKARLWPLYALVTVLFYLLAVVTVSALGGKLAWVDAVILVGSMLAQFLLDNKKLENWVVWAVIDVLAIWEYAHAGLSLAAFQYVFFLANTVWGFVAWQKSRNIAKSDRAVAKAALNRISSGEWDDARMIAAIKAAGNA